jgi:hypothetical protein
MSSGDNETGKVAILIRQAIRDRDHLARRPSTQAPGVATREDGP